ncbi:uncharacterized protein TrAtP1_002112 [Trichoderma atroviride]|uniref:uncharacterized protein n=2 Tax=Hypocrea atroviridis TaxID=63577 RepID=UPI00331A86B3|nr:hypothetical protein TrAtP1_002112 [Trichoderma atroviride]
MDPSSQYQKLVAESLQEMQETVKRFQNIQIVQEQRIIELGRQLESYRQRQAEFAPFSRLPPELRRHIWRLAIPSQVFRPFRYLEPSHLQRKSLPPPTISRVCREARQVAYLQGTLYRHDFLAPVFWTWFSGRRDVLDLSSYCLSENGFIPLQTGLLRGARTIILDVGLVNELSITGLNSKSSHFQSVKTIYLSVGNPFQVDNRSWQPQAVARLFRDQSFALIDVEDDQELEHLEQILCVIGNDDTNAMSWWHREAVTRLQDRIRPPAEKMKAWRDAKMLLSKGWMSHRYPMLPLAESFLEQMTDQEARRLYPQLPTVKLVQTFELTPVSRFTRRRMREDIRG